jgi:hypothetical protein
MQSSVSQGEAVGRRPKARKIDGIKLAFLPRLRGISPVKLAWQARDAGIAVRLHASVTVAESAPSYEAAEVITNGPGARQWTLNYLSRLL